MRRWSWGGFVPGILLHSSGDGSNGGAFDEVVDFLSPRRRSPNFRDAERGAKSSERNDAIAELGASNKVGVIFH
jgi:hypothetical protein